MEDGSDAIGGIDNLAPAYVEGPLARLGPSAVSEMILTNKSCCI